MHDMKHEWNNNIFSCVHSFRSSIYAFLNVQRASGKKFQDVLEEAFVHPLNVEGEFYIGIPSGEIHEKLNEERLCTFVYITLAI